MTPHVITLPLSTLENMLCELNGRFDELSDMVQDILSDLFDLKLFLLPTSSPANDIFDPLRTVGKY